jgi:hypothetical protein
MSSFGGCSLNQTTVQVNFNYEAKKPFTIQTFNSNGSLNSSQTSNFFDNYIGVNADSSGGLLTVVGTDACGYADSAVIVPWITVLSKNITIDNKCPGVSGTSGSGDVNIYATTFSTIAPVPQIIKKNGVNTTIDYSYSSGSQFSFPNLLSGVYIIKYTFAYCSQMVYYDTVEIKDYVYPTQNADTAIQCGGNMFTFTFPIVGGLNPYTFQVIGSTPSVPSLVSAVQSSPSFNVGTGQHYTNVKVRAIDRCGNSTIGDVTVQPINGCSVLQVDTVGQTGQITNRMAKVFPNPSRSNFTISISQKKKTDYRVEIVNASGIKVYNKVLNNIDREDVQITTPFIPGLYIINVSDLRSGRSSVFKQLVK